METPDISAQPQGGRMRHAARRFFQNPMAVIGLVVLTALVLVALVGPVFWTYGYTDITPDLSEPPSWRHPLGTDTLGRDMMALSMRGMQQSLLIAGSVALIACVLGTLMGVISGYFGGFVDAGIMRLVDLVLTIPTIALAAFLGNSMSHTGVSWVGLSLVLGALYWTSVARLVRGVSLSLREMPFIKASQVMGASHRRIMLRHLIPNVADHIIVATALLVGVAILSETGLSFLGFGVRPPDTSLGLLISNAQSAVLTRPWMFYAPGVLIILIVLSINYIGEGLRDAFNPKASVQNPLVTSRILKRPGAKDSSDSDALVAIDKLTIVFPGTDAPAVNQVDLQINRGEVLAVVGESGSGKSLTSLAIAGLIPVGAVQTGRVQFDGKDVGGLDFNAWRALRGRRIATILQDPATSLNPVLTIGGHFLETFRTAGAVDPDEVRVKAIELMELMAIRDAEARLDQYPYQMSGGMRQRIVIALAMVHEPGLIIADEPTTALDVTVQAQVLDALRVARERCNAAMLFITHDLALVAGIADRVAVMKDGQIVESQDVFSIFDAPQQPYTRHLLALAPRLDTSPGPASAAVEPLLRVAGLSKEFRRPRAQIAQGKSRHIRALDGVSFDLAPGETLGIVGESGSGKTTLLNTILGLYQPSDGSVQFDGQDTGTLLKTGRKALARDISVVFQDPYTSLDPRMTIAGILAEPAQIHNDLVDLPQRMARVLAQVHLPPDILNRFPHEFSGGQRQRIAIARALMLSPRLIVLDEPVSALDVSIQRDIIQLLDELQQKTGVSYLLVAHDLAVVADLSNRIGVMYGGQMVELGETHQIVSDPQHPYTQSLLDAVPIPDPKTERARLAARRASGAFITP